MEASAPYRSRAVFRRRSATRGHNAGVVPWAKAARLPALHRFRDATAAPGRPNSVSKSRNHRPSMPAIAER